MGQYINKRTTVDSETGEVLKEKTWTAYDGFNENGYKYRNKSSHIKYFFDALPDNLSEGAWVLLFMIAEIMNEENVLIYRVKRKSKFSSIIYKPYSKDELRERLRFKYGKNKFDACWKELCKHCIKEIDYYDFKAWAVNPSVISKCRYVPYWLYEEFDTYMNPFLSATTIKKLQDKISDLYY